MDGQREPVFARELNVTLFFETYQDPEQESKHRTAHSVATSGLYTCERLFWAMQHLAYYAGNGGLAFRMSDFFETAQTIGELGRAVARSVTEEVDALEHAAECSSKQGKGAK